MSYFDDTNGLSWLSLLSAYLVACLLACRPMAMSGIALLSTVRYKQQSHLKTITICQIDEHQYRYHHTPMHFNVAFI
jgi:hypothetical protein